MSAGVNVLRGHLLPCSAAQFERKVCIKPAHTAGDEPRHRLDKANHTAMLHMPEWIDMALKESLPQDRMAIASQACARAGSSPQK
jgi:hypothetical protein